MKGGYKRKLSQKMEGRRFELCETPGWPSGREETHTRLVTPYKDGASFIELNFHFFDHPVNFLGFSDGEQKRVPETPNRIISASGPSREPRAAPHSKSGQRGRLGTAPEATGANGRNLPGRARRVAINLSRFKWQPNYGNKSATEKHWRISNRPGTKM